MGINNIILSPDKIRAIRERLGLTQVEAGELIGGGQRAFTKYEAGTVKPSAAVVNLLRLLDANPTTVSTLQGNEFQPTVSGVTLPFEVSGVDIVALTPKLFPKLLRRLLYAEALANNIPFDGIHVASNINSPDGGEDACIKWSGGPDRTQFLPSRLNQFQLKSGKIRRDRVAREILTRERSVKAMVSSVIRDCGNYILLCAHSYTNLEIQARKNRIREAIRGAGMTIDDGQVDFQDADQIAVWVNMYPTVALWLKEKIQHGTIGPFRSWNHWANRTEHYESHWVEDERLPVLRSHLREQFTGPRQIVRVVGLTGIGKSRLILEALDATGKDEVSGHFLRDLVMYSVLTEAGVPDINLVVQNLVDSGKRAIVVVDNCDPGTHHILASIVLRETSLVSLLTIDDEIPTGSLDETVLKINQASSSVIENIIDSVSPNLSSVDKLRLVHFSKGFPKVALSLGRLWKLKRPLVGSTDDDFVDDFVLGRSTQDRELLLKSATLLAAFGLVRKESTDNGQLADAASLGLNLSTDDFYTALIRLIDRGVVQERGKDVVLQPRPIAMKLTECQWKEWTREKWDKVLTGDINPELKVLAAQQLSLLDTTEISKKVVRHVCRTGGPFDSLKGISKARHAEVLSALAEVDPQRVADQIDHLFENNKDLQHLMGDVRRYLVLALEKITFCSNTFEEGAHLLLRFAVTENKFTGNYASSRFKALFPVFLGNTEADSHARLRVLEIAVNSNDPMQREIVVDALCEGCQLSYFSRTVGAEVQGTRPAMDSWHPSTNNEVFSYAKECVERLALLAVNGDEAGDRARSCLGLILASLIRNEFIDTVEKVVLQVTASVGYWSAGLRGLKAFLAGNNEHINEEVVNRILDLIAKIEPTELEQRLYSLVTEPPLPEVEDEDERLDWNAKHKRYVEKVRNLAVELLQQPSILAVSLPKLSRGGQYMADYFGTAIAHFADSPLEWLDPMVQAVIALPEHDRNFDLLSGFVAELVTKHPDEVDAFKRKAAVSLDLVPVFPGVCLRIGIDSSDLQLTIDALQGGTLPPRVLNRWTLHGAFDHVKTTELASLFDAMLDHSIEAYTEAVVLMGNYAFDTPEKLEEFRPQILKIAGNATRWNLSAGQRLRDPNMYYYHFEEIMNYILDKGRKDSDARALALALARTLAKAKGYDDSAQTKPVLSKLLSCFPEIAWPLIGQAILSGELRENSMQYLLGNTSSFKRDTNPLILNLPEETLFAWCHAHPAKAPAFVAKIVPVLASQRGDSPKPSFHPTMIRLLDEFGDCSDVQEAVISNMHSVGWWRSSATYLGHYEEPLTDLLEHPKLRHWAKKTLRQLRIMIRESSDRDQEREAQREVRPNIM